MRDERTTNHSRVEYAVEYRGQSEMHHRHNLQSALPVVVLSGDTVFWTAHAAAW